MSRLICIVALVAVCVAAVSANPFFLGGGKGGNNNGGGDSYGAPSYGAPSTSKPSYESSSSGKLSPACNAYEFKELKSLPAIVAICCPSKRASLEQFRH